jgi:hypothetical protein
MSKVKRRLNFFENLKDFVSSKPPTVVFLVCLFSFVVVLASLSSFVNHNEIRNVDEEDWNAFRDRMTEIDFCIKYPKENEPLVRKTNLNAQLIKETLMESFSYDVTFIIDYGGNKSEIESSAELNGVLKGFHLGLQKSEKSEIIQVDFKIGSVKPTVEAKDPECAQRIYKGKKCFRLLVNGCMTLTGLASIFPKTNKKPEACSFIKKSENPAKSLLFSTYKESIELTNQFWCPSSHGAKAKIKKAVLDPKLFSYLTKRDKEIITKNVTYILLILGLIITLSICVALFTTSKKKAQYYPPTFDM